MAHSAGKKHGLPLSEASAETVKKHAGKPPRMSRDEQRWFDDTRRDDRHPTVKQFQQWRGKDKLPHLHPTCFQIGGLDLKLWREDPTYKPRFSSAQKEIIIRAMALSQCDTYRQVWNSSQGQPMLRALQFSRNRLGKCWRGILELLVGIEMVSLKQDLINAGALAEISPPGTEKISMWMPYTQTDWPLSAGRIQPKDNPILANQLRDPSVLAKLAPQFRDNPADLVFSAMSAVTKYLPGLDATQRLALHAMISLFSPDDFFTLAAKAVRERETAKSVSGTSVGNVDITAVRDFQREHIGNMGSDSEEYLESDGDITVAREDEGRGENERVGLGPEPQPNQSYSDPQKSQGSRPVESRIPVNDLADAITSPPLSRRVKKANPSGKSRVGSPPAYSDNYLRSLGDAVDLLTSGVSLSPVPDPRSLLHIGDEDEGIDNCSNEGGATSATLRTKR